VYIPLGGNRRGTGRQILNIAIVWALTGLWHGASWNFLFWGVYFGIILVLEKLFLLKFLKKAPSFVSRIYSLILIVFGWLIFYYSDDVGGVKAMAQYIRSMFTGGFLSSDGAVAALSSIPILVAAGIASTPVIRRVYDKLSKLKCFPFIEAAAAAVILIICTASLVNDSYNPFLYFKF
jgi:alginate O-acetyltransferase complex protein AlgI